MIYHQFSWGKLTQRTLSEQQTNKGTVIIWRSVPTFLDALVPVCLFVSFLLFICLSVFFCWPIPVVCCQHLRLSACYCCCSSDSVESTWEDPTRASPERKYFKFMESHMFPHHQWAVSWSNQFFSHKIPWEKKSECRQNICNLSKEIEFWFKGCLYGIICAEKRPQLANLNKEINLTTFYFMTDIGHQILQIQLSKTHKYSAHPIIGLGDELFEETVKRKVEISAQLL